MYRRHALAKRRTILAAGAVYAATRAIAYVPDVRGSAPQEPIIMAAAGIPALVWVYVAAWTAVAVLCLARIPSGRLHAPTAALVAMMLVWGGAWGIGWAAHPDTLWWQTAITYAAPAVVIAAMYGLTAREGDRRDGRRVP